MTTTIIDEYILPTLVRYIDEYRWRWPRSTRMINMYYGTEYKVSDLKALYQKNQRNQRN